MFLKAFKFLDVFVATINKNIAVIGISLGVMLVFVKVVLRYSLTLTQAMTEYIGFGDFFVSILTSINGSMTWADELSKYLFIWSALFGAAYGFKKGIHISVTIVLNVLPQILAKGFLLLSHLITFIYLALSAYLGYELIILMMEFDEMSIDLEIPMWIPQLVLPIAFAFAAFRAGEKVYEIAKTDSSKVLSQSEAELIHDSAIKE